MENLKIINKNALISNLNYCKGFNKQIIVMVKANAYGHGLKQVVNVLKDKVKYFGVANEKEAIKVKRFSPKSNILVVGKSIAFSTLILNDIEFTIDDIDEVYNIIKECKRLRKIAKIHIAINTGMNRIGVKAIADFKEIINMIDATSHIKLIGIFTHCFDADLKLNNFNKQMVKFKRYCNLIKDRNLIIHIGGSYCLSQRIPKFISHVRTGFYLYGYGNFNLKPVMKIESYVAKILTCQKGENIGYGKTKIKKKTQIATIPMGYADGVPRNLSGKAYVYLNNQKCKIIGKICMDVLMIDITDKNIKLQDRITIMKDAMYFAKIAKTSPYEILTNFSKARAKVLIKDG